MVWWDGGELEDEPMMIFFKFSIVSSFFHFNKNIQKSGDTLDVPAYLQNSFYLFIDWVKMKNQREKLPAMEKKETLLSSHTYLCSNRLVTHTCNKLLTQAYILIS